MIRDLVLFIVKNVFEFRKQFPLMDDSMIRRKRRFISWSLIAWYLFSWAKSLNPFFRLLFSFADWKFLWDRLFHWYLNLKCLRYLLLFKRLMILKALTWRLWSVLVRRNFIGHSLWLLIRIKFWTTIGTNLMRKRQWAFLLKIHPIKSAFIIIVIFKRSKIKSEGEIMIIVKTLINLALSLIYLHLAKAKI